MLRKAVCEKCRNESGLGWMVSDDENWKAGLIYCPSRDISLTDAKPKEIGCPRHHMGMRKKLPTNQ